MRKLILLMIIMAGAPGVFSQVVLNEDFSSGQVPPTGWTIDAHAGNWAARQSANAGGSAPEAGMSWSPEFNGATRLISPQIDLSGQTTVLLQFNHMIDHYSGNYQIGVATRKNSGAWTNAWTRTITTSIDAELVSVAISDVNVNSSSFQFCIFFSGNSYNINDWYIDNIVLIIPAQLDAAISAIEVPTYFTGSKDVNGKITNMGTSVINSFMFSWQVGDGEIHSNSVVGQNLTLGQTYNFTSTDQVTLDAGIYDLNVWVSNVNGIPGPDNVAANDTMTKVLRIPTMTVGRKPLFEEFTSSTCGPCASFNNSVFNPFIEQNGDDLVLVKYQMDWPGSGDPYYTEEGGQRRYYYGVNAVPMLFVDGKNTATSSTGVNTAFGNSLDNPAFVTINAFYTISGNEVAIDADITAYTDIENATLHVVVLEGVTTENHASNGETEFHHVMMRLLPDGNGSQAVLASGVPFPVNHVVDMTGTNVEEMNDLLVAVFLQDNETKEIFQAAYATLTGALVNMTPANMSTEVLIDEPLGIEFSVPVRMVGGNPITGDNVASLIQLEKIDAKGTPVPFTADIDDTHSVITVTPVDNLEMSSDYLLIITAVENMNGMVTHETSSHFTTQTNVGLLVPGNQTLAVYPNPASDYLTVTFNESMGTPESLKVFNISGLEMFVGNYGKGNNTIDLNVTGLPSGIYILKLSGTKKATSVRFIIQR
ncbi:MAG: T9SS type A sorting domain-containing protein [Bacteroidota bacterium]